MTKIIPFKGLRPQSKFAAQVATLPYDVVNTAEAKAVAKDLLNFYHVTRAEIDVPDNMSPYDNQVYQKAKDNLEKLIEEGVLFYDEDPCYYVYELTMNGRSQSGLIAGSSIDDYNNGVIKKHEFTRPEKELDRINHIKITKAQTGIVFLAYKDHNEVQTIIKDWKAAHAPAYDFVSEDGIGHRFWVINEYSKVAHISLLFAEEVEATYIADGHHRAASAAKVAEYMRESDLPVSGEEAFNYFITAIFPASELAILDYNRVVKDLNGLSTEQFLQALQQDFILSKESNEQPYRPQTAHEFGMYLDGQWYCLKAKDGSFQNDVINVLDVSILQNNILSKLLNINDPRTDKRLDFVGGIRGLKELEHRVNSGDMAAAFSCYPVSIQQLFDIADQGQVMPPKSTWFEPKTRDGLVVYTI